MTIVAIGSGFFSPSITPLFGAIYKKNDDVGREVGFTIYYIAKNIGALLAPIICGYIGIEYGHHYAFLISATGMFSGVFVFFLGKHRLKAHDSCKLSHSKKKGILFLIYLATGC